MSGNSVSANFQILFLLSIAALHIYIKHFCLFCYSVEVMGLGVLSAHTVPSILLSEYCDIDLSQNNTGGWRWRSGCRASPKATCAGDLWQFEGGSAARHQWHPTPHSSPVCVCSHYFVIGPLNVEWSYLTLATVSSLKSTRHIFLCLTCFFFILSGAIPAWSWCCGGHQMIPSVGGERARYRNSANNRQYLGNPRLLVHLPSLTAPPVHLQTHTLLCTPFLWPTALERRTWKCKSAWWPEKPK